jgi:uncharacterized protein (TIGR02466 family)
VVAAPVVAALAPPVVVARPAVGRGAVVEAAAGLVVVLPRSHRLRKKRQWACTRTSRAFLPVQSFFSTRIYAASLPRSRADALNRRLLAECLQLRGDDVAGRRWSRRNYPGGFTSYASAHRMHEASPVFARLKRNLDTHVKRFVDELELDLGDRPLAMTDCWVNVMPQGVAHSLHLHPLSVISGTYYVRVPRGAPGLKFEDPRLDRYMGAPPRRADAVADNRAWVVMPAAPGSLLLFESWLRHEVVSNQAQSERVSISFNYGWH